MLVVLVLLYLLCWEPTATASCYWVSVVPGALPRPVFDNVLRWCDRVRHRLVLDDERGSQPGRKFWAPNEHENEIERYLETVLGGGAPENGGAKLSGVEFRQYFTGSKGMDWHRDEGDPDDLECVLVTHDDSDATLELEFRGGVVRSIKPKPNTLVMLRPGGIKHRVTNVTRGTREIIKFRVSKSKNSSSLSRV